MTAILDRAIKSLLGLALLGVLIALAVFLYHAQGQGGLLDGLGLIAGLSMVVLALGVALIVSPGVRAVFAGGCVLTAAAVYVLEWSVTQSEDRRTKAEVVADLRQSGDAGAVGSIPPVRLFDVDEKGTVSFSLNGADGRPLLPLGGVSATTTAHCREFGRDNTGWIVYKSDEHGFNNPRGIWDAPSIDVVFHGDSMTHGNCVPLDRDIVSSIRKRFPATLNLAMQGNGPMLELAGLKEFSAKLKPTRVVWMFIPQNDITDIAREAKVPLLQTYLGGGASQDLIDRQPEVNRSLRDLHERNFLSSLDDEERLLSSVFDTLMLRMIRTKMDLQVRPRVLPVIYDDETLALFERVILDAKATVEGWGGEFYFAYLPSIREVVYAHPDALDLRRRILEIATRNKLKVIDVNLAFNAQPDPVALWQCRFCHYSLAGFRIASDAIDAALAKGH